MGRYAYRKNNSAARRNKKMVVYPRESEVRLEITHDRHRCILCLSHRPRAYQNEQQLGRRQSKYQRKTWGSSGTGYRIPSVLTFLGHGIFADEKTNGPPDIMGRLAAERITQITNAEWHLTSLVLLLPPQ